MREIEPAPADAPVGPPAGILEEKGPAPWQATGPGERCMKKDSTPALAGDSDSKRVQQNETDPDRYFAEFERWYRPLAAAAKSAWPSAWPSSRRKGLAYAAFQLSRRVFPLEASGCPPGFRPLQVFYETADELLKALEARSETAEAFSRFSIAGHEFVNAIAQHTLSLTGKALDEALDVNWRSTCVSKSTIEPEFVASSIEGTLPPSAQGQLDTGSAIKLIRKRFCGASGLRKRFLHEADRKRKSSPMARKEAPSRSLGEEAGRWAKQHLELVGFGRLLKTRGKFCHAVFRPLAAFAREPARDRKDVARSLQIPVKEVDRRLRRSLRKLVVGSSPDPATYPLIAAVLDRPKPTPVGDEISRGIPEHVKRAAIERYKREQMTPEEVRELERQDLLDLMGAAQKSDNDDDA